jgi:dienelactone hydrolase
MFHSFFFFEIPITAGALAGLLAGIGWAAPRLALSPARRRVVAVAAVVAAVVVAGGVGAWSLLPGPGGPVVREDPAALAAIPALALPDPSQPGPFAVVAASYGSGTDARRPEFGAETDWRTPTVDASTGLKARDGFDEQYARWFWGFDRSNLPLNALIWYPADAPGRLPVVLIAHGNHDAGSYSDPGYTYLGEHLASRGIIVASVDLNFLNGDAFFDYGGSEMGTRAWLLLRHLAEFRTWDATPGHPLAGRVDLERVALIGHSRGGEAAAVAAMLEADPDRNLPGWPDIPRGFGIRAVAAIAPSDGMYQSLSGVTRLDDLDYLVIQGAHDGDLPGYTGLQTYHRVTFSEPGHLKVAVLSHRANHGRFNSVWDIGDAGPLDSWMLDRGSMLSMAEQQRLAKTVIGAFLARSLGGETGYDAFFREPRSGRAWLPDDIVETHWQSSERILVEDFTEGLVDRERNEPLGFASVTSADPPLRDGTKQRDRAASLTWANPASYTVAVDATIRGRLEPDGSLVFAAAASDDATPVDTVIELRTLDGQVASVRLADVAPGRPSLPTKLWKIDGLGDRYLPSERQPLPAERFLQTYAIDLAAFRTRDGGPSLDPARLASITFRFEGSGALYLDDIGFEPAGR